MLFALNLSTTWVILQKPVSKLISVNGKTSIEGGSEKPDTPSTGDTTTPNGNFETWVDGKPNNWKTASSAGNASVAQSTDAHSGKYSVKVGGSTSATSVLATRKWSSKLVLIRLSTT